MQSVTFFLFLEDAKLLIQHLICVNLVNMAFVQPNKLPIAKEPRKIPKKSPIAEKKLATSKTSLLI